MDEITIAPPPAEDHAGWRRLYDGYAAFYKMPMTDEIAGRVWGWLHDPQHPLEALLARTRDGEIIGLAHFRAMPRPLTGSDAGFLDDLFVAPELRGARIGQRLIEAIAARGRDRGWTLIRWLTADNNYRARGVYDKLATRTHWITYQLDIS